MARPGVIFTNAEREFIARSCYEYEKNNKEWTWTDIMNKVRESLPGDRRFASSITNPSQITWLRTAIENIKNGKPIQSVQETRVPHRKEKKAEQANGKRTNYRTYNEEERKFIAQFCLQQKSQNPEKTSTQILKELREILPEEKKFNKSTHSFHQLSWLPEYMEKLKSSQKPLIEPELTSDGRDKNRGPLNQPGQQRPILDGRQKLQTKTEEPVEKKARKKSKTKVFLEHDEKLIFAEQVLLLQKQFPGIEWKYVLKKANEALPEDRRVGKFPSANAIGWLEKYKAMAEKKLAEEAAKPVEVPAPVVTAPVVPAGNPLADAMAKMMETMLADALAKVTSNLPAAIASAPQQKIEITKQKVLVVGMLPHLGQDLQREFGRYLDLTFFGADTGSEQIKDKMKNCDYAFLMTKFVSHSTANVLRGHPNFTFCNGTVTALKEHLSKLVVKH